MTQRKAVRVLGSIVLLLLLSALGYSVNQTGQLAIPDIQEAREVPPGFYAVTEVADGDTFRVRMAGKIETVRLIGIDTPETRDPRTTVQCFGEAASDFTKQRLSGKTVRLEADPDSDDRDRYQRLLRYAYLEDGTMVNQLLVEQGYAFAYTLFPHSKLEESRTWERIARENNRGLWAGCSVDETNQKKQTTGGK